MPHGYVGHCDVRVRAFSDPPGSAPRALAGQRKGSAEGLSGRAQRKGMVSTNAHDRRWMEVNPQPDSAVLCTGVG
jgi:hypothetical protein